MSELFTQIKQARILPVITINSADNAVDLAHALRKAGLNAIEITFRTAAAAEAIHNIVQEFPDMLVGAGTVLTPETLDESIEAGATFSLAPGLNPELVKYAATKKEHTFIPAVATVSEVDLATRLGLKAVKLFPATLVGGPKFLQAVNAVYPDMMIIPTGGVNINTMNDFLSVPNCLSVGGTWIAPASLIDHKQFSDIEKLAKEALAAVKKDS